MSTPQTSIYMCSGVPLNNRYDHTLYFASKAEQETYFASKVVKTYTDYTYARRSWKLKVAATMEVARVWSYLFFRNGTAAKTYYYFINHVEYVNENTVELSLELDVLQTYCFEWTLRPCYVEREHSVTDNVGDNTVDEGLDVGEFITARKETVDLSDLVIMTAATGDIWKYFVDYGAGVEDLKLDALVGANYGRIFSSFQLFATPLENWADLAKVFLVLNTGGVTDAIFTVWEYPRALVNFDAGNYDMAYAQYVRGTKEIGFAAQGAPTTIDGYTPKNKKLLQYPYCFLYATNNAGGAAVYQYHLFDTAADGKLDFNVGGNLAPDATVRLTPMRYKGVSLNVDESLLMGNFPICSWNNDTYKMWLAQNQNQQNMSYAMSGLKIVGGAAAIVGGIVAAGGTGGAAAAAGVGGVSAGVGMIASGVTEIGSQLAQKADKEIQPPQARGGYSGSHNVSRGFQNFDFYHKTIDSYHAKIIDNYFTMYGYACRQVKTPNINSRPAFNYVKTIGANITGNFCMEDVKLINTIFDKGVTFWKNTDVGNYALDNTP